MRLVKQDTAIEVRMTKDEKKRMEDRARELNFNTLSQFIRSIALYGELKLK